MSKCFQLTLDKPQGGDSACKPTRGPVVFFKVYNFKLEVFLGVIQICGATCATK